VKALLPDFGKLSHQQTGSQFPCIWKRERCVLCGGGLFMRWREIKIPANLLRGFLSSNGLLENVVGYIACFFSKNSQLRFLIGNTGRSLRRYMQSMFLLGR
jgi:hypothetical protein